MASRVMRDRRRLPDAELPAELAENRPEHHDAVALEQAVSGLPKRNSWKSYLRPQARIGSAAREFARITATIAVRSGPAAHSPVNPLRTRRNVSGEAIWTKARWGPTDFDEVSEDTLQLVGILYDGR